MPTKKELQDDLELLKTLREKTKKLLDRVHAGEEISAEEQDKYLADKKLVELKMKSNMN